MVEKIIIKGKLKSSIPLCTIVAALGLLIYLIDAYLVANSNYKWAHNFYGGVFAGHYTFDYAMENALGFLNEANYVLIPLVFLCPVIAYSIYRIWSKSAITITNRRVYGVNSMGNRVDLPIDTITAVGTGIFNSLTINTASVAYYFVMLANRDELHKTLSNLLVERQN